MYLKVVITRSFAEIVAATRYPPHPQEAADTDLAKLLFGNR